MNFGDIVYLIFIWPIHFLIEFLFLAFNEVFAKNTGIVIVFISIVINIVLLPLYNVAEKWQKSERLLQDQMKPVLSRIRRFYRGDERQMLIRAFYRQKHYSPLNSIRASAVFLLQIPFFIAAYQFLSHSASLNGSFLFITDLGAPDSLIRTSGLSVNVLPLVMTAINLLSALVYTKNFSPKEKIQLFSIPAIFLVLLYRFPSGMVLYWTVNNLFSLFKNLTIRYSRNPRRILYIVYAVCLFSVIIILGLGLTGVNRYQKHLIVLSAVLIFLPLTIKYVIHFINKILVFDEHTAIQLFFFPLILITLIIGIITPLKLLSSASPEDFLNPFSFFARTFLQALSFFIIFPLGLWSFTPLPIKRIFALFSVALGLTGTTCYFFFSPLYGTMTRSFIFENTNHILDAYPLSFNILLFIPSVFFILAVLFYKNKRIILSALQIVTFGFALFGLYNILIFSRENIAASNLMEQSDSLNQESVPEGFFKLSSSANNVLYFFLDRAVGIAFFDVLKYFPDLQEKLDGFTFYPNTLSFSNFTVSGLSTVLGGYDYSPTEINKRANTLSPPLLEEQINESYSILPSIYGDDDNRRVFIINPPIATSRTIPAVDFFNKIKNVSSIQMNDYYKQRYKQNFFFGNEIFSKSFDYDIVFRYGLFRTSLPIFRYAIYFNGKWWRDGRSNNYEKALSEISALHYLENICSIDSGSASLCIMMNELTHEDAPFDSALQLTSGSGQLSYLYTYCAAFSQLCEFFSYLKQNAIYDNTKIIIVSDHGKEYPNSFFEEEGMERFNPVLLIKNYDERGPLTISDEFMTNADAPLAAASEITNSYNRYLDKPFTRPVLFSDYDITICNTPGELKNHYSNSFKIIRSRKLLFPNIFGSSSWENWKEGN